MQILTNIKSRARAVFNLPGFHAFTLRRPLKDLEVATMMLSALAYKRHVGDIHLFGTKDAIEWAKAKKLTALYDGAFVFNENPNIDHRIFWASAKLYGLEQMTAPCCCTDIDCVLFRRPNILYDAVALHSEPENWCVYQWSPMSLRVHEATGLKVAPRSMKYLPANTAVMSIHDEDLRQRYVTESLKVMELESRDPITPAGGSFPSEGSPITQMVVSEQYMFSAVCSAMNKRLGFLCELSIPLDHMPHNEKAMHLWNSKRFYYQHHRARERYMDWVMEKLRQYGHDNWAVTEAAHVNGLPTVRVFDSNTGNVRWSYKGEWTGSGEIISEL